MSLEDDAPTPPPSTVPDESPLPEEPTTFLAFPPECTPRVDHLIVEDNTPVESLFFERLMRLLVEVLYCSWAGPGGGRRFGAFANVGLFWEPRQTPLVPDVMLSLDVDPGAVARRGFRSYFLWEFGKIPDVVFEFVSDRLGGETTWKQRDYLRLRIPYYVVFDPFGRLGAGVLRVFELRGLAYEPIDPRWLPGVGLGLTLWEGMFEDIHWRWLRWCDQSGQALPTSQERIEQERRRADRLADKLRSLGIDPTTLEAQP
jgi:hypothetical protein